MNIPIGGIIAWREEMPVPLGFIVVDGSDNHLISEAPDLAEFLGTTFGAGYNPITMYAMPHAPDQDNEYNGVIWIMCAVNE
jgi:hypothetical protein